MKPLSFLIQGSSEEPYSVQFFRDEGSTSMTVLCTCRAAAFGNFCKHRIQLILGNPAGLVGDNEADVQLIAKMVDGTDVELAVKGFLEKEKAHKTATNEFKAAKKFLSKSMQS